jgi:hypothetical protein
MQGRIVDADADAALVHRLQGPDGAITTRIAIAK